MKFDFNYYNPTKIYFGRTALDNLSGELSGYGKTVLLMYGKGSVKKLGLYDKVVEILKDAGKTVVELSGIKSNPSYSQLLEGVRLVRENNVDLILAVGGGSVIDCAKGISVLTMAGTGSEMNGGSVITNEDEKLKNGRVFPPQVNPKFSILNPEYTFTVPAYQMSSGIFDTMSHLMEQYFSGDDDNTTDYILEGVMRSLIHSAGVAVKDSKNYEARSNIMWCATIGLNTVTGLSKEQDWEVHMIEHQLGAYTDCAHGAGLAAISVPYYKYIYKSGIDKFVRFSQNVWGINTDSMTREEAAEAGIEKLGEFIKELGLPSTLKELGATEDMLPLIASSTIPGGGYKKMNSDDILKVLKECY